MWSHILLCVDDDDDDEKVKQNVSKVRGVDDKNTVQSSSREYAKKKFQYSEKKF